MKNPWGHEYSVALVIRGEELDPDAVTRLLGLKPSQSWRKGENYKATSKPALVSGWEIAFAPPENTDHWDDLESGLEFALETLEPLRQFVQDLASKWDVVWWIGHYQSCFDGGPGLSATMLRRLGEFGVELDIDNYFYGQDTLCFSEEEENP